MDGDAEVARRLRMQVEAVLDHLRPGLLADGGNVELVGIEASGVVSVRFQGSCLHCPARLATLRFVLEATLRKEVPGFAQVLAVEPVAA